MTDPQLRGSLYIGGEWLATDRTFEVTNPYDGSLVDEVHLADEKTMVRLAS